MSLLWLNNGFVCLSNFGQFTQVWEVLFYMFVLKSKHIYRKEVNQWKQPQIQGEDKVPTYLWLTNADQANKPWLQYGCVNGDHIIAMV